MINLVSQFPEHFRKKSRAKGMNASFFWIGREVQRERSRLSVSLTARCMLCFLSSSLEPPFSLYPASTESSKKYGSDRKIGYVRRFNASERNLIIKSPSSSFSMITIEKISAKDQDFSQIFIKDQKDQCVFSKENSCLFHHSERTTSPSILLSELSPEHLYLIRKL